VQKAEAAMVNTWQIIADAGMPANPLLWDPRLLWLTLGLLAIVLGSALFLVWLDRWRRRSGSDRLSAQDQLSNFRELYEQGQLSQEEFERIRDTLTPELRRELDLPVKPSEALRGPKATAPKSIKPGSDGTTVPLEKDGQSPFPSSGDPPG
jgi:hypothetical protein